MDGNPYLDALGDDATQATNPYLSVLDEDQRNSTSRLQRSLEAAQETTPDTAARVVQTAEGLELSPDLVAPVLEDAERALRRRQLNPAQLQADSPRTAALLSDKDFAALAHDDTETLTAFEQLAQPANTRGRGAAPAAGNDTVLSRLNAWRYQTRDKLIVQPFERGRATNALGRLYFERMDGADSPARETEIERLEALMKHEVTTDDGVLSWALANNAELAGQMVDPVLAGAETGATVGMTAGAAAALAGPAAPITTPVATAGGFAAGMASELLSNTFYVESGHAFKEFSEMKALDGGALDRDAARGAALLAGTANTLIEAGGLSALASVFGVSPQQIAGRFGREALKKEILTNPTMRAALAGFGKRIGQGVGIETVQEVAQELVTILAGEAAQIADGRAFEPTDGALVVERLGAIAAKTATGAVGLSAVGSAPRFIGDAQRAERAENNKAVFDAIAQNAQSSKLAQRLPARLQAAYDQIAKGGPVENVYVNAGALVTLFQGDVNAATEALPSTKETLATALAADDFVSIPVGEFATKLAGTDQYASLAEDIKLRPDDFSPREAEAWRKNYQADFERELAQAETEALARAEAQAPAERVQTAVTQMLRNAGVANNVATTQARLWGAFFGTVGQRAGVDPEQLFQRYQVQIMGEAQRLAQRAPTDQLGLLINRARNGREANARELFGPSLFEWLAAQGGVQDLGGELGARDLDKFHQGKPFQRRLVREDGMTFEEAAGKAVQAGYLNDADTAQAVSLEAALLAAFDREAQGTPVYAPQNRNEALADQTAAAEDLRRFLEEQGADINAVSDEEIRELLGQAGGAPVQAAPDSLTLDQGPVDLTHWPADWPLTLPDDHPLIAEFTMNLPGREELREAAIQRILAAAKPVTDRKPIAWVMGDGGGSGKGTVLSQLIANGEVPGEGKHASIVHIDPDEVKAEILEFKAIKAAGDSRAAAIVHEESSFIAKEALGRALAAQTDLVLDSTLGDRTKGAAQLAALKKAGYEVRLVGVSLDTATALARAAGRAAKSGRYVPPQMLRTAHQGFSAAWAEYVGMVDAAWLYDNNGPEPVRVLAAHGAADVAVDDELAYNRFRQKAQESLNDGITETVPGLQPSGTLSPGAGGGRSGARSNSGGSLNTGVSGGLREGASGRSGVRSAEGAGSGGGRGDPLTLFQAGTRGSIQLPPTPGDGPTIINLFQSSDLTTFFHESAHFFLEVMRDLASDAATPLAVRGDYETITAWLGTTPEAKITREQHEKFARGFEAYLFEGKSPNPDLDGVFARVRAWFIAVYKELRALNVRVNDDVRDVFDRMLASEEQIDAARRRIADRPMLDDPVAAGLNPIEAVTYSALAKKYHDDAVRALEAEALRDVRTRLSAEYKARRESVEAEVTAEINATRIHQVIHLLRTGEALTGTLPPQWKAVKFDRQDLVDTYGEDFVARLPGTGRSTMVRAAGGVPADAVAAIFGYPSGDALLTDILNARPREQEIRLETERRMAILYGDTLRDARAEDAATEKVHNDARGLLLAMEALALSRRNVSTHPAVLKAIKAHAAEQIARLPVARATKPFPFVLAARRAGQNAERAMLAGNLELAAAQKRAQLLNHALAQEAYATSRNVDRALGYLKRFEKQPKSLAVDYWQQITALLAQHDLRRAITQKELARRQSLRDFLDAQLAKGTLAEAQIAIDPRVLANTAKRHYTELTAEAFRGLVDSVRNLAHLGALKQKLLKAQDKRDFDATVSALVDSAIKHPDYRAEPLPYGRGPFAPVRDVAAKVNAAHIKPEFAFEYLDNNQGGGAWWSTLFKPIADAEAAELEMMHDASKRFTKLLDLYSRKERALWHRKRRHFPRLQTSLAKDELLALALNWGNDINRQRLLSGHARFGWTQEGILEALDTLDARDWQFVQGVWDLVNSFWPQIAAFQKRLTGLAPVKVDAVPVPTKFGVMPGGYYPLKYDNRLSDRAQKLDEKQSVREQFGGNWAKAQTRQGHLEARKENVTLPVLLDLSVASQHLENVIHDITHREAVIDVDRLLQDDDIAGAIKGVMGTEFYRTLRPWLQSVASDRTPNINPLNRVMRHARHGMTVVSMGLKLSTILVQPLGFTQSIELLGERAALTGLQAFYGKPWQIKERIDFVLARSPMMRRRMQTFDRDVRDIEKAFGARSVLRELDAAMFAGIGIADMMVSLPTWLGAYDKGMADFKNDEAKAIAFADRSVRLSQGSGAAKDLPAIQRGEETARVFTMFYSYFSTLNNLLRRRTQLTRRPGDAGRAALGALYLVVVPAVLAELVLGRGPDDDEGFAAWAAKKVLLYPAASWVLIRDIANAVGTDFGYSFTPVADAFRFTAETTKAAAEGDFDRATIKSGLNALGVWLKLPTRQAWLSGEYLHDYFNGDIEDFSLYELLVTGDKQ